MTYECRCRPSDNYVRQSRDTKAASSCPPPCPASHPGRRRCPWSSPSRPRRDGSASGSRSLVKATEATSQDSVAFCSTAKGLIFGGLMENPLIGKQFKSQHPSKITKEHTCYRAALKGQQRRFAIKHARAFVTILKTMAWSSPKLSPAAAASSPFHRPRCSPPVLRNLIFKDEHGLQALLQQPELKKETSKPGRIKQTQGGVSLDREPVSTKASIGSAPPIVCTWHEAAFEDGGTHICPFRDSHLAVGQIRYPFLEPWQMETRTQACAPLVV